MATAAENELLTQTGKGTPMGELLRRYWHPIAALKDLEKEGISPAPVFDQVILAAPDVDRTQFDQSYDAIRHLAKHASIYASANDFALKASDQFWVDKPRLGDSRSIAVFDGIDTIDVSQVDLHLFGMGHAFFVNNPLVVQDLVDVIGKGASPPRAHLEKRTVGGKTYWAFAKQE